ncbi:MAG: ester cyclase [Pseudomonadota bacterium]
MTNPFKPGFDPKWKDVPDYILGITKEIWEDRQIGTLRQYYAPDLIVRSPASVVVGNQGIIAATQTTLAEFPDRELPGEDVIWCDTGSRSFLSSHRLLCTATHLGHGAYGVPTGRKLIYRILADCWCQENAVHDEWLVRDQAAIVQQMGFDLVTWVRNQIAREGGPAACVKPFTPGNDVAGPYKGRGTQDDRAVYAATVLTDMMGGDFGVIARQYDRAVQSHYPAHSYGFGHGPVDKFWLGLRSAVPSAQFTVHHQIGKTGGLMPDRAALRWSLDGNHDGWGRFGPPTGAPLHVMGITHFEFGSRGVVREWSLIDDTAVWRQILLATGDF